MMKISIVIPTIGSPDRSIISESIRSALEAPKDIWFQIIVVDNSRDIEFSSFLSKELKDDERVEIIQENSPLNMAQCWNKGLEKVKGNFVLFLHDDDILTPSNLPYLESSLDIGFINFGFQVFGDENCIYTPSEAGIKEICQNTPKLVSTIINSKLLKQIGGWDPKSGYFLDFLAFIELDQKFGSQNQRETLGKYRLHQSNASSRSKRNKTYGDHLPYVLSKVFEIVEDESLRREILFSMLSFTYTNNSSAKKVLSNLAKTCGFKAWLK